MLPLVLRRPQSPPNRQDSCSQRRMYQHHSHRYLLRCYHLQAPYHLEQSMFQQPTAPPDHYHQQEQDRFQQYYLDNRVCHRYRYHRSLQRYRQHHHHQYLYQQELGL